MNITREALLEVETTVLAQGELRSSKQSDKLLVVPNYSACHWQNRSVHLVSPRNSAAAAMHTESKVMTYA